MPASSPPSKIPSDPIHAERAEERNATEAAFESLLADIVAEVYPPGARLPAERELARKLGASRPTLREALRRLAAWHLVDTRRGSGILVRPRREWSVEVLPAYLRYGGGAGQPAIRAVLADALALRRSMIFEIIALATDRIPPGGTAEARAAAREAWALRGQPAAYAVADFEVTRALVEAAGDWPALWLLNRFGAVYGELVGLFSEVIAPPSDYLETHESLFEAIEANDGERALALARGHFEPHDQKLLDALGAPGAPNAEDGSERGSER